LSIVNNIKVCLSVPPLHETQPLITNVYKAKDIKTAEAAKVIENIQRDLNIALVNLFI
jgi:UDP-N-acetyl-D-mannosaminuronate dehydrogenase